MSEFTITFKNFGLFVNRPVGATVILGHVDHRLAFIRDDGSTTSIPPGTEIRITDGSGTPLPAKPTAPLAGELVGDLSDLLGTPVSAPDDLLTGAVDPALVNARVVLAGGALEERPCSIPFWREWPYQFPNMPHFTTDLVVFHHEAADDVLYELHADGQQLAELRAGTNVTFYNEDDPTGPKVQFGSLKEFCDLCRVSAADCGSGASALSELAAAVAVRDAWALEVLARRSNVGTAGTVTILGNFKVCAHFQTSGAI